MNDKPKVVRGPRKTSSRSKGWFKKPDQSARLKALWADPAYREKMTACLDANRGSRVGVPDGTRKRTFERLKKKAVKAADRFIEMLEKNDELINVPDTDIEMAKSALKEAYLLAVLPGDKKIRMAAINTVLSYTKAKPESKSKVTIDSAEDWLKAAQEDMKNND
jgi:hypothetical protein